MNRLIESGKWTPIVLSTLLACLSCRGGLFAQSSDSPSVNGRPVPSFKDIIGLQSVGSPRISPDGHATAYTVRSTDWEANRFDREIWLARSGEEPFQLTRTNDGSSTAPRWSPDSQRIAFLGDRGDKTQIQIIGSNGGEAWQLTKVEEGISSFKWSPDGKHIVFSAVEPTSKTRKAREKAYGQFAVEDQEARRTHLWIVKVLEVDSEPKRLTEGEDFTVGNFGVSPDGTRVALDHYPDPSINSRLFESDISLVAVETGEITLLVDETGSQRNPRWSPDGKSILFSTSQDDLESMFYTNTELAVIPATGGTPRVISKEFDENPAEIAWTRSGIYFLGLQKTKELLHHLDQESGKTTLIKTLSK